MSSNSNLEIEVKFLVHSLKAVRERLLAMGADLTKERVFEENVRFDTPDERLLSEMKLLRLRQDTAVTITFKGKSEGEESSEARVREELEIEASDFDTAHLILQRVGFQPAQRYEKYRETFQWRDVEIVLDEMPFGDFVELEGEGETLKTAADELGLAWDKRILTNYLSLMAQVQEAYDLPFNDLTFANFADVDATAADVVDFATTAAA